MYATINNKYGEADIYAKPVVVKAILKEDFKNYILQAAEKMEARTTVSRNNFRMRARLLGFYLDKLGIQEVNPDENFIKDMWENLKIKENREFANRVYEWETCKKVPRFTRDAINDFLYPKGLVQRPVLKEIVSQKYEKFLELTQNSREAVKWFEENGKRVEAIPVFVENKNGDISNQLIRMMHRVTKRELKPVTKSGKVEHAIRFLKAVNKNGFEHITVEDVKNYESICLQRGVKQKEDYLAHVATFFINIYDKGFIKTNPLAHVSLKMNGGAVKKDFITEDGMTKLKDLTTLDKSNKEDVRDRLVVMLAYDLAVRISELMALNVSDFRKDEQGEWYVTLKPENQKGYKDEETMYFWFDETKQLLDLYLTKVRKQFNPAPAIDSLILSNQTGKCLSSTYCSTRVKMLCDKFGVKTYYDNEPSPHVFRHTFATLNIEPIGLSLSLYDMAQRLRHSKVETTRKHYIHNNPYLKKIKHAVQRKNSKVRTPFDGLNETPLADFEHWMSDKLGMDSDSILKFRIQHKKVFTDPQETPVDQSLNNNNYISEDEALGLLKDLKITACALRNFSLKKGHALIDLNGNGRYGKRFRYLKEVVEDLSKNYVLAEYLRSKRKLSRRTFYRLLDREKWRAIKIGKVLYVNRLDYA
jgi:integrase